jgi:hypothetical protein
VVGLAVEWPGRKNESLRSKWQGDRRMEGGVKRGNIYGPH